MLTLENIFLQIPFLIWRLNKSEASMLEEMASKSIPWLRDTKIASWNPRTTLDHVMFIIKCWHGEVIINRMHLKSSKRIHRCTSPLPYITCRVENASHVIEIYRRWSWVRQGSISLILFIVVFNMLQNRIVLILCRESETLSTLFR